ncbi:hypothetical protein HDV03_000404 [Kappamyces sp. JEL0829]|nr:hypothetical protein HDV03_000404 [Kappamyces sp. JEL0829]
MAKGNIAVIGSGFAGLSAAHLLSSKYNVTLLERNKNVGMDIASVSVSDTHGNEIRIDSPMRGITKSYYPTVFALYQHLGIKVVQAALFTSYGRWFGNGPGSMNASETIFSTNDVKSRFTLIGLCSLAWSFLWIPFTAKLALFEFVRLLLHASHLSHTKTLAYVEGTMGQWLEKHHFSLHFQEKFLAPFFCAMATCTQKQILSYPAKVLLHLVLTYMDESCRVEDGVRTVCSKLLAPVCEVVYDCEIVGAWNDEDTGKILVMDQTGYKRYFDQVVFAGQALLAKKALTAPPPADVVASRPDARTVAALGKFAFIPVRVVIHTDDSLMPSQKDHWRGANLVIDEKNETMATLWINYLHKLSSVKNYFETSSFFVTPEPHISPEKIISSHTFPRSIVTKDSCDAIDELELVQGRNGFYFVGSWAWPGMPLLEGCVASSVRVAERLGKTTS